MTTSLPEPLIPADVDLRAFPFTPMFRARLFGSSFHAKANDAEWRAGVTLWLKSWDQAPAGTLPDDDVDLCRLAELGRDHKTWAKVRARALHGWIKCSDGRLHHAVVAEGVLEAWERHKAAKKKGKAGAEKRWGTGNATATEPDSTGITQATAQAMPGDSNRQGQHTELTEESSTSPFGSSPFEEELSNENGKEKEGETRLIFDDPAERLARFQRNIADAIGSEGWPTIAIAVDFAHQQHTEALARCQAACAALGKKWPWHLWPKPRALPEDDYPFGYDGNGEPNPPPHCVVSNRTKAAA